MWSVPLIASAISLFFSFIFIGKLIKHKTMSNALFAIAFFMYAIGSFANFYGAFFGWHVWVYKWFYGAGVALVGYLAAAVVYTKIKPIIAHLFLAYVVIVTILMIVALIPAETVQVILVNADFSVDNKAMADSVRKFSFPLSGVGGIVLIFAALWSWWSSRLAGHIWILGGAALMSVIGRLATMDLFSWLVPFKELAGIVVIFYGVMLLDQGKLFLPRKEKTTAETV